MKKFLFILITFVGAIQLQAQEQPAVFDQYLVVPIVMTPAVAGFDGEHHIIANFNSDWTGFDGAQKTYSVQYHGAIGKILGLGVGVLSENIGSTTLTRFQLNYAAHFDINERIRVAGGFSTDFYNRRLANSVQANPLVTEGDQIVIDNTDGVKIFDAALGFWGEFNERTYVGLTFPNLVVTRIGDIEGGENQGGFLRHVVFNVGHKFDVAASNFTLEPSLLIRKYLDVPTQIHFNVLGGFLDEQLQAGLSYRAGTGGALGILLGTKIDVFRIYYSFGVALNDFQQYSSGKHEVTVGFSFGQSKNKFDRD